MTLANASAIRRALENAGVELIEENGGGLGVRRRELINKNRDGSGARLRKPSTDKSRKISRSDATGPYVVERCLAPRIGSCWKRRVARRPS